MSSEETKKSIHTATLLTSVFALTYYMIIAGMSLAALLFNEYIVEWAGLSDKAMLFQSLPAWVVILIVFIFNVLVVAGLIIFLRKGSKVLFFISSVFLMVTQIYIGGFDGWQKLLLEGVLIGLVLLLPHHKKMKNVTENAKTGDFD